MLPKYEAIDVIKVIPENVGHTKPWVVLANTPDGLKSFVTKLYTTSQVDNFHCVSKEIICNFLALEFDLNAPPCALIDIPEPLCLKMSSDDQQQYDNADLRPKFATLMLSDVSNAMPTLPKTYFKKRISLDMLYAFDNLIRNSDRGHPKSNLLIGANDAFLIDHELTLAAQDIVNIDIDRFQLGDKFTKYHLFYPYLKKTRKKAKQNFFNDFSLYLNNLSINKLTPFFNRIKEEGFTDYSTEICNWLEQIKQNSNTFVNKLKGSLQ